jgi:LmbE family N-acetylglucosaminyl deacetylase
MSDSPRLLILGAHPDDAEYHGGGLATIYKNLGREVKLISVTNGAAGHHWRPPEELIQLRREEAAAAGRVIGATYETWNFPDAALQPTLEVRERIIREVREFRPDLVLTHRTNDYHPDHRAVGQAVQDASYLVTVPHVLSAIIPLHRCPVIAYLPDLFSRPVSLRADVVIDVTDQLKTIAKMLSCHQSQVFEWLAYEEDLLESVPSEEAARLEWAFAWFCRHIRPRADHFREQVVTTFGAERGATIEFIEAFEISEYAPHPNKEIMDDLFPQANIQ